MQIRRASEEDGDAIREIARRSLVASYPLSPGAIDGAIDAWYDDETLAERLDDAEWTVLVAEADDEVAGFAEGVIAGDVGEIHWLHVDPDRRGEGIGDELFERLGDRLSSAGADRLQGRVLAVNAGGNDFYEDHGFERVREDTVEIGDERYVENIYAEPTGEAVETVEIGGETRYVDQEEPRVGSRGAFFPVFEDADRESAFGYYCSNCGSTDVAMDTMERIECTECGNRSKPTRWDAAYL